MNFPAQYQWPVFAMFCCSLAANLIFIFNDMSHVCTEEHEAAETVAASEPTKEAAAVEQDAAEHEVDVQVLAQQWKTVHAEVKTSITKSLKDLNIPEASALSAVYSRLFMWDLNMRRDLQKGDKIEVVYRLRENGLPDVAAARFHSRKMKKTLSAYRWLAPNDKYASYWSGSGNEAVMRLKETPIHEYEQITSLLKDGRGHQGMDFKTPVGTDTFAARDGVVTRINFGRLRSNGYCVEVRYHDGVLAKWLHLDKINVVAGARVRSGEIIGKTGNTGRSTAPHLHYQLNKGSKVIDPLDYHKTVRRSIPVQSMDEFLRDIGPFTALLDNQDALVTRN